MLVERDDERSAIERQVADAMMGLGSLTVLEGPAGTGKSRLLEVAADVATGMGMRVLSAFGTELERHFPFGVAIQLFEPWWLSATEEERNYALSGAGNAVRALLSDGPGGATDADVGYATVHGLFRLALHLSRDTGGEHVPMMMLVDDAQWVDRPSVRLLAYLATRLTSLPVALIVAMRPGEPDADTRGLAAIRLAAGPSRLRLRAFSSSGVETVVRTEFPDADDAFCAACARITGGNPFLLMELLEQVGADDLPPDQNTADRLENLAPNAVLDAVVARLGAMPTEVRSVAAAVAILGDGAALRHVAALSGLDSRQTVQAADALAQMHLFTNGEPLSFIHPLIRQAVDQSMSVLDRGHEHARAATVLHQDGQPAEVIAPHLLASPAQGDPSTVAILRAAAHKALTSGAAQSAVAMLRRALSEGSQEAYADLLAELAQAEVAAGLPQAAERLAQAIKLCQSPVRRAELALTLGWARYREGRYGEAAAVLAGALLDVGSEDPQLTEHITATHIAATSLVPPLAKETERRGEQLIDSLQGPPSLPQRAALAHLALHHALRGQSRDTVRHLADMAWGDGELLDADCALGPIWPMTTEALLMVDELERALELGDLARSTPRTSSAATATAEQCSAWAHYERGDITAAAVAARTAVDALPTTGPTVFGTAYGAIAGCLLQQDELSKAETALGVIDRQALCGRVELPSLLLGRSAVRMAQRRHHDALVDALEAGRLWEEYMESPNPGALAWRSAAALAQLALGQTAQAKDLATEELGLAKRFGVTRIIIRDLRVLGLAKGGEQGITLLREAVSLGAAGPPRLEYILALVALGGALRRGNQRAEARGALKEAIKLSERGGAIALAREAKEELAIAGSRRRGTTQWGPKALTPSERRVAELAANGLTTREIAESLFVTRKTVEYHLRHIYQKLGVNSRDKLGSALNG